MSQWRNYFPHAKKFSEVRGHYLPGVAGGGGLPVFLIRICIRIRKISTYVLALPDSHPDPLVKVGDPRIRILIRIHTTMSQIRNTGLTTNFPPHLFYPVALPHNIYRDYYSIHPTRLTFLPWIKTIFRFLHNIAMREELCKLPDLHNDKIYNYLFLNQGGSLLTFAR